MSKTYYHRSGWQAALNSAIPVDVANSPLKLDREAQQRRQDFLFLDGLQKAQDFRELVRMNGPECASRQIFRLRVYEWQRRAA